MNIIKKITLTIILTIALPISLFFIIWTYNTINQYFLFDKFSFITTKGDRLYRVGLSEYYDLKYKTLSLLGLNRKTDYNFFVQEGRLSQLNSNLPKSGTKEQKAYMLNSNILYKGKLRYRGDNFYHWIYPQKSWRFKTSKKDLYKKIQKINFIIPKGNALLNNHLSYQLATELNLLAPQTKLTEISINNTYNGVKLMAEQIDESFLRAHGRVPNDIYKGDNMGQKSYRGVQVSLFNNASIWEKASYNNHYEKLNFKPLSVMMDNIQKNDYSLYSLKDFAAMSVFIDMIGAYHFDDTHNWILYYDNYYEKMYPIIWDPVGWWPAWVKKDNLNIITSDLLYSLYSNYDFIREKYKKTYEFYINNAESFDKSLLASSDKAKRYINKNGYTFGMGREYLDLNDSLHFLDKFTQSVKNRLGKVEKYYLGKAKDKDYKYAFSKNKIRLSINGSKLINKVILKLKRPLTFPLKEISISIIQNNKKRVFNVSNYINYGPNNLISINTDLLANGKIELLENGKWKKLVYKEATYDIDFKGLDVSDIENIQFKFFNLDNQIMSIRKVPYIEKKAFKDVYNILEEYVDTTPIIWSDIKNIKGFNLFKKDIIINEGTKIILDHNATLKILGKVTAIGTKENPIVFEAKDKTKPWNAFALKDAKANGSVFKHCIFKDGSGDKGDLYEYTAMLSIHNVKDFLIEDCEFYDSHRTDDMVHVIYSDGKFKNTNFIRSLSDALDVDISNVIVDNCKFIDSGNDAIDLMTTNALVTNTSFYNSADKGISIGEGSALLAINNYIEGSEIGMQSKDTSKAYIYNTSFIKNKKAIDAYHKNWRYSEGGTIVLEHCIFDKNILNATVGKKSKVIINNSNLDMLTSFDNNHIKKNKLIITNKKFIVYELKEPLFKGRSSLINKVIRGYNE